MPLTPITLFQPGEPYNIELENRALRQVEDNFNYLESNIVALGGAVAAMDTRYQSVFEISGSVVRLRSGVELPPIDIGTLQESTQRKVMTTDERIKLKSIAPNANDFKLIVGKSNAPIDGTIEIVGGKTIRVVEVPTATGVRQVRIDTLFPPDRIHEHAAYIRITHVSGKLALIPHGEEYVAGTLRVFKNGIMLAPDDFVEEVDNVSGRRDRFTFGQNIVADPAVHTIWAEYERKPKWSASYPDPAIVTLGMPAVKRWLRDMALGQPDGPAIQDDVTITLTGGDTHVVHDLWLIDVTDLKIQPNYNLCQLSVNGVLYHYGFDWDFISHDGSMLLRWRYATNPVTVEWMQLNGQHMARVDLVDGDELVLNYYTPWDI